MNGMDYKQVMAQLKATQAELEEQKRLFQIEVQDRKQAVDALAASNDVQANILSSLFDAVFLTDKTGKLIFFSPNAATLLAYSEAEIWQFGSIQTLLGDRFTPATLGHGALNGIVGQITDKLGRDRTFLVNVKPVNIGDGTVLYTCHDVTEAQAAMALEGRSLTIASLSASQPAQAMAQRQEGQSLEQLTLELEQRVQERTTALQNSEERWQLALKGNNDGIWDWDVPTDQVFYSTRYKEILGFQDHEFPNHRVEWIMRLHPDDLDTMMDALNQHLTGQTEHYQVEYRLLNKAGHYVWILDRGQAVFDDTGRPVRMVGSHTDISDRKQAEEDLQASQAKFQRLVDDIGENFVIFSHIGDTGILSYVSGGFEAVFGMGREEIIGKPWAETLAWLPEDIEAGWDAIAHAIANPAQSQQLEMRFVHPDGYLRTVLITLHSTWSETGELEAIDGILEDITDRKQQAEALALIVEGTAAQTGAAFFQSCVRYLAKVLNVRYAIVSEFANGQKTRVRSLAYWVHTRWLDNIEYDITQTPCEVVLSGETCYYPNQVTTLFPNDHELIEMGIVSYCGMPLVDAAGQILGHLAVLDTEPMTVNPQQTQILQIFAARAGAELSRMHSQEELARQVRREQLLSSITNQIRQSLDIQQIFQTTVDQLGRAFKVSRCNLHTYSPGPPPRFPPRAEYLMADVPSMLALEVPVEGNPHVQQVLAADRAVVTPNVYEEPLLPDALPLCEYLQIKSMIGVRTSYQGVANGVIGLHQCDRYRSWTEDEVKLIEAVAAQVGIAIAQANLLQQEQQQRAQLAQDQR